MRIWDCHSDVLSRLLSEELAGFVEGRGAGPAQHYDLPRLEPSGVGVLVCALFTPDDTANEHPVARTLRMIDRAHTLARLTGGRVEVAPGDADVERIVGEGRTALVLSIENGIACLDKLELLRCYRRLGVRALGLTWNGRNAAADGCRAGGDGARLTPFGRDLVAESERLGVVLDVSHLSSGCFWDLLERTEGPPIASHSNARWLCDHPRNLTREQVRAIAERGGVIGVNFFPGFLRRQPEAELPEADLSDVVAHIAALLEVAGEDGVGIGSDYDGIQCTPRGLDSPAAYPVLLERLRLEGLGEEGIAKLLFGNFRRVFAEVEARAARGA